MRYAILHDIPGRLRVCCLDETPGMPLARSLGAALSGIEGVISACLSERTGSLLIRYGGEDRNAILARLRDFRPGCEHGAGDAAITVAVRPSTTATVCLGAAARLAWRQVVESVLPKPIHWVVDAWKMVVLLGRLAKQVGKSEAGFLPTRLAAGAAEMLRETWAKWMLRKRRPLLPYYDMDWPKQVDAVVVNPESDSEWSMSQLPEARVKIA